MSESLFATIRRLVMTDHYVISQHAIERLEERGILEWQVVEGIERAELLSERPDSLPNPSVELLEILADGVPVKAVWSWLVDFELAKLVTVHFFDDKS